MLNLTIQKEVIMATKIISCPYVSDYINVKRSFVERLFTAPWRPLKKYKSVKSPTAYIINNGVMIVSPETYKKMLLELEL